MTYGLPSQALFISAILALVFATGSSLALVACHNVARAPCVYPPISIFLAVQTRDGDVGGVDRTTGDDFAVCEETILFRFVRFSGPSGVLDLLAGMWAALYRMLHLGRVRQ